ncbi:MAG: Deoxyribose-phosphate aldolase [Candidatus Thorarchaeota archaeon]|nr:MAG: Deoxyribose-phosphate aldolase [Candidatus Thorarchaeota archaeon]
MNLTIEQLAQMIDHTELKPNASQDRIRQLCQEALQNNFAAVCINPVHVKYVSELLKGSSVKVCCVVGFPLGANVSEIKAKEAEIAVSHGAQEIDMVLNIGALLEQNYDYVMNDIHHVVMASGSASVKVILETGYLSDEDIRKACLIAKEAGADFVKTSTGFGPRGASVHDVEVMYETIGTEMKIKAAGGIRTYEDALEMIKAGADRLGASAGIAILSGFPQ